MRATIALASMLFAPLAALAQSGPMEMTIGPAAVKWGPAPPVLPKGAQIAVLSGDPFKPGPYVLRLKLPAGYQIPAHHHPTTENVTVLSGQFYAGMGDKLDKKTQALIQAAGFSLREV